MAGNGAYPGRPARSITSPLASPTSSRIPLPPATSSPNREERAYNTATGPRWITANATTSAAAAASSSSQQAQQHPAAAAAAPARSSRRYETSQRPGTASTVSSYTSARPYPDDNSPIRRTFALPSIDSVSSHQSQPGFGGGEVGQQQAAFNANSPSSTAHMLLHGGASVYTLPIGGNGSSGSGNGSVDHTSGQAAASLGKRQIVASATSAYGPRSDGGDGAEDVVSISSSRRTIPVYDEEMIGSISERNSPRKGAASLSVTTSPRSANRNLPDSQSGWTSTNALGPRNTHASPASVPVHPHHRKRNEDGSLPSLSTAPTDSSMGRDRGPGTPSRSLNSSLPATPVSNNAAAKLDLNGEPTSVARANEAPPPAELDQGSTSPDPVHVDKSQAGSGAIRERLKKTGGFFRRLGGAQSGSSSGSSSVHEPSGTSGKGSKLGMSASRMSLSRKSSHASMVTEGRADGRNADLGSWTREDGVPVPEMPEQFRSENKARVKAMGKWQRQEEGGREAAAAAAESRTEEQGDGVTPSNSAGMNGTLSAWEKEMDAVLETSVRDLAEATKIEAPRPNWTPSPQLPEYRVLNRKGSFMDEGARDPDQNAGSDDSDAEGDSASRYTTVRSYMALSTPRSNANSGRGTLSDAFGLGVPGASGEASERASFSSSQFLSPDRQTASAGRSTSTPLSVLDRRPSRTFSASTSPAMSSTGAMTDPVRSSSKFVDVRPQVTSYDEAQTFRRARQENASSATTRSFETAVDRQSSFILQTTATTNEDSPTSSRRVGVVDRPSPFASKVNSDVGHDTSVDLVPAASVDASEPSIRLINSDPKASQTKQTVSASTVLTPPSLAAVEPAFKLPLSPAEDAAACAERCWNEDEAFKKREKIAEWLGGYGEVNKQACILYFARFDYAGLSVDLALRKLCDRLYLRAETQQVDRILAAFSQRYYDCNRTSQFRSADVIHAVTFSILLLNTDLHVAEMTDRMTRTQFVRNTIDAIVESNAAPEEAGEPTQSWEARLEGVLRDIYNSVKSERIRLPIGDNASLASQMAGSTIRPSNAERFGALKRGSIRGIQGLIGSHTPGSGAEGDFSPASRAPRSSLGGDRSRPSLSTLSPPTLHLVPTIGFASTLSKSIIREANEEEGGGSRGLGLAAENDSVESLNDEISDEDLALMGAPFAKEGMLTRKQYWETPQKRAKDKSWTECFVVIQKGQLSMFRFGSGGTVKQSTSPAVGGGNWLENATCIGQFSLAHSLANILPPPGYSRSRPHVFALSLASGGVFFFQTGHEELAQEWTSTCNYWAARLSKEPLAAGVSNMEYGWNRMQSVSASSSANEMADTFGGSMYDDGGARASGAQSVAGSIAAEEEQMAESSPSTSQLHLGNYSAIGSGYGGGKGAAVDTRSIRSGRSSKSGRVRAVMSHALFQNWNGGTSGGASMTGGSVGGGHSMDRTMSSGALGHQSGISSPVASMTSLSTPNTSVATLDRPLIVHEWRLPAPPTMSSTLGEEEQLAACVRHSQRIETDLTEHNSLRQPMMAFFKSITSAASTLGGGANASRFGLSGGHGSAAASSLSLSPKAKNASAISLPSPASGKRGTAKSGFSHASGAATTTMANRAMANWERKSAYLLAELTKYQVYVDSLNTAHRLRAEKRGEKQVRQMMKQAELEDS